MPEQNESAPTAAEPPTSVESPPPISAESPPPTSAVQPPDSGSSEAGSKPEEATTTERTVSETHEGYKSPFERKLGMANTIVQILAILIGGTFAIIKFGILDSPTLQRNLRVSGELGWVARPPLCRADLDIEITNLSKSSIEVKKVRGQAWLVDEPSSGQWAINYFDMRTAKENKVPVEVFSYKNGPLVQTSDVCARPIRAQHVRVAGRTS